MSTAHVRSVGSLDAMDQRRRLVALRDARGSAREVTTTSRASGRARSRTTAGVGHTGDALAAVLALAVVQGGAPVVDLLPDESTTLVALDGLSVVVLALLWTLLLMVTRANEARGTRFDMEDVRRIGRAGVTLALLGWAGLSISQLSTPPIDVLSLAVTTTALTLAVRLLTGGRLGTRLPLLGAGVTRVVVAGHEREVAHVLAALRRTRDHGFEVVAACVPPTSPSPASGAPWDVPVSFGLGDLGTVVDRHQAEAVIVLPCLELDATALRRLGWQLEQEGRQLFIGPGLLDVDASRTTLAPAGGIPFVHVRHAELRGIRRVTKECSDRLVAGIGLVLTAPLLLLLAVAVKCDSSGPAFFRQLRVGRDGRPFMMLKLRTMATDAEVRLTGLHDQDEGAGVLFKMRADPRVTRVGRFLRTYSLDELPQLVNVVRGEMSLVGPRPPLPGEVALYDTDTHRRLAVKPGLTGLWQVSGRSDLPWEEALRLDLSYVENWSLAKDVRIVGRTFGAVLAHRGAY